MNDTGTNRHPGATDRHAAHPSLRTATRVWARVALLSFGGPAGQIAVMQRILVDELRWVGQQRFLHALNLCMLLPGPEAQQLATYIGWMLHRWRGALVAGLLFVLPGFLSILALSIAYVTLSDSTFVQGVFLGIKPAVLVIVIHALLRIARRALRSVIQLCIATSAFAAIFALGLPFPFIILLAATTGFVAQHLMRAPPAPIGDDAHDVLLRDDVHVTGRPSIGATVRTALLWLGIWLLPVTLLALALGREHTVVVQAVFFSKVATVTFGGAYAVLAYVAQQAVEVHAWLRPGEMLDGLGMAETTPGPLIQVVQFVGFMGAFREPGTFTPMTSALLGAVVTTWVTFAPCFLWILTAAPWMESLRGRARLDAALSAITAAVTGVILNLSLWFAFHTLFRRTVVVDSGVLDMTLPVLRSINLPVTAIAAVAALMLFVMKRSLLATLGVAAVLGVVVRIASAITI